MFARVITAQAGAEGFDGAIRLFEQQLPGARQQPGFNGYYLLTDAETGKLVIISLWETREQMDAVTAGAGPSGVRDEHVPATGLSGTAPGNLRGHAARLSHGHSTSTPVLPGQAGGSCSAAAGPSTAGLRLLRHRHRAGPAPCDRIAAWRLTP